MRSNEKSCVQLWMIVVRHCISPFLKVAPYNYFHYCWHPSFKGLFSWNRWIDLSLKNVWNRDDFLKIQKHKILTAETLKLIKVWHLFARKIPQVTDEVIIRIIIADSFSVFHHEEVSQNLRYDPNQTERHTLRQHTVHSLCVLKCTSRSFTDKCNKSRRDLPAEPRQNKWIPPEG